MNFYAIIQSIDAGIVSINADYYQIDSGFVRFYVCGADDAGGHEEIAAYSAGSVESVVKQKQYTEAEVIAQVGALTNRFLHMDEQGRVAEVAISDISMDACSWPALVKIPASGPIKVWGIKDGVENWREAEKK